MCSYIYVCVYVLIYMCVCMHTYMCVCVYMYILCYILTVAVLAKHDQALDVLVLGQRS